ncbi:hypothetical protein [Nocardioides sp. SR21]|uniref:hypothetical protein n=1 Tax=Nocardioides sp. SR21 TaxID=2919501 RepID=UPI001FA9A225|nr:hypothetical protein [Nocardioides sp. SR21]
MSTLPRVNLLPESAFERMAARRLRRGFVAAGVVLMMLVGGAWAYQHVRVAEADKLVAIEAAKTSRLTSQTQRLQPVRVYVDGVAVQVLTVQTAMADDVFLSEVLEGIQDATPVGAELATVAITMTGRPVPADPAAPAAVAVPASACPGPDPFNTRVVVGCVTLAGTAASRAEVGEMVVSLGKAGLFVEPFISTTTTGESDEVSFSGSVGLSEKVFSGRYAPEKPAGES